MIYRYVLFQIFEMIFQLRANSRYEIGLPDVEDAQMSYGKPVVPGLNPAYRPKFTPYIIIDHKHGQTLAKAASTVSISPANAIGGANIAHSTPGADGATVFGDCGSPRSSLRRYMGARSIAGVTSPGDGANTSVMSDSSWRQNSLQSALADDSGGNKSTIASATSGDASQLNVMTTSFASAATPTNNISDEASNAAIDVYLQNLAGKHCVRLQVFLKHRVN